MIPEDGLRRLLKVCEGKNLEARRDTALIMLLLDAGARRDELMSRTLTDLDLELDVLLVLARAAASVPCRSAARARWRWTATCASATGTSTPICPGCGSA